MMRSRAVILLLACAALQSCSIGKRELPLEAPPLADLEEPLDRREEPRDEDARQALDHGSFTGLTVSAAGDSLDALTSEDGGLEVRAIVENSPADFAGVAIGDLVVEVRANGATTAPRWPSEWRAIELATPVGSRIDLVLDRANVEREVQLTVAPRAHPADRQPAERFREEARVGVVLRTATEVEARAADLGPGGGAVVVGLSRASPWRAAGVRFGDLIRSVDGVSVAHPAVVIEAIRSADEDHRIALEIVRDANTIVIEAGVTERESEVRSIDIPLIYSYDFDRGRAETSCLFGLYYRESTPAAWRVRLLWFIDFSGGDADRLEEESATSRDTDEDR